MNHADPEGLVIQRSILVDLELTAWLIPYVPIVEIDFPPAKQIVAIGNSFAHVDVAFYLISPDHQAIVALYEIVIALPIAGPNEPDVLAHRSTPNDVTNHVSGGPFGIALGDMRTTPFAFLTPHDSQCAMIPCADFAGPITPSSFGQSDRKCRLGGTHPGNVSSREHISDFCSDHIG